MKFLCVLFCAHFSMVVVSGVSHQRNILERKTKLFHVEANHFEPYLYTNLAGIFYKGMEFELMETLKKKLQLKFVFHNRSELNLLDGDGSNLNQTDMQIGGLFPDVNKTKGGHLSIPYGQDELTWCIQKSKNYPMIYQCMLIAHTYVWLGCVFIYGYGCGIMIYILISFDKRYNKKNQYDCHYAIWQVSLTAFFGLGPKFRPVYGALRIFFGMMLVIGFFCSSMLGAYIHKFLTHPQQKYQIATIDEMVENGFRLVGTQKVLDLIKFDSRYTKHQIDTFFVCNLQECLNYLNRYENYDMAVGGSRNHIMNSDLFDRSEVFCFDRLENVVTFPISLWMKEDSTFNSAVDNSIRRLFEAGLPSKWIKDRKHKTNSRSPYQSPNKLQISHLGFAICLIYFPFICGSCLTFCLEYITSKNRKQPKPHWIWMYLEQLCDGHRHYLQNLPRKARKSSCFESKIVKKGKLYQNKL